MINNFKNRLGTEPLIGLWSSLNSTNVTDILASSGADWILIDMEHGPIDVADLQVHLQIIAATPASPIVRVPSDDPVMIKRVLDVGASTLLVPLVETAEQAKAVVAAACYPPEGRRGITLTGRASGYGRDRQYLASANDAICLIVQIETENGVRNAGAIAGVHGIDALFVGPSDLAASMGHCGDPRHEKVEEALQKIVQIGRSCQMPVGFLAASVEDVRTRLEQGYSLIAAGADARFLVWGADEAVRDSKAIIGETVQHLPT